MCLPLPLVVWCACVDVSEAEVRAQLGVVLQSSLLINGTIADNVRLGRPSASDEDVAKAVEMASCTSFVSELPDGLNTVVGSNTTVELSGGQEQRICLARALCR